MKLPKPKYLVEQKKVRRSHLYIIDGGDEKLKSVTKVCGIVDKPALVGWAANQCALSIQAELLESLRGGASAPIAPDTVQEIIERGRKKWRQVRDDAGDVGTACHEIFFRIVTGKDLGDFLATLSPEQLAVAKKAEHEFRQWWTQSHIEIVACEIDVASKRYHFGGRLDAIGYKATASRGCNGWGIVDYKTSNGIYKEAAMQAAGGYVLAVEEMYGIKIDWVELARFSKKEPWGAEVKPVVNMEKAKDAFVAALNLTHALDDELIGDPIYSTFEARKTEDLVGKAKEEVKKKIKSGKCPF